MKSASHAITLGFVGDIALTESYFKTTRPLAATRALCRELTDRVDIAVANLECSIFPPGRPANVMAMTSNDARVLTELGFDVYCLANNHIKDYGPEVLCHTRTFLEQQGLRAVGAGSDIAQAQRPLMLHHQGLSLAILNVTDASTYSASAGEPGVAPLCPRYLRHTLGHLRQQADLVIICIHADMEFSNLPAPWKLRLSRRLIDQGADIIIHHHPHCLQGIERYRHGLIACSLGNFVFQLHGNPYLQQRPGALEQTGFLEITATLDGTGGKQLDYRFIPLQAAEDNSIMHPAGEDARQILDNMANYSSQLQSPGRLAREFHRRCRQEMRHSLLSSYYQCRRRGLQSAWHYWRQLLGSQSQRHWIRGFFTLGHY